MADAVDGVSVRMNGFKELFADLPDPRSRVNRQHLLVDVVAISVCGVLAGADGPTAIFTWADCAQDWLKKYLELPAGIPSKDCIRRVLQGLQPEAFQRCFAAWLNALVGPSGAKFLSIDGKTLRRSHDGKQQLGPLHLVSVWANEQGLTLGQVATAEKSNEITAIPLLLDLVDVKDAIISIDAMGTQKAIAGKIIDKGGDYVLPVKGNQGNLEAEVQTALDGSGERIQRDESQPASHHGNASWPERAAVVLPDQRAGISDECEAMEGPDDAGTGGPHARGERRRNRRRAVLHLQPEAKRENVREGRAGPLAD